MSGILFSSDSGQILRSNYTRKDGLSLLNHTALMCFVFDTRFRVNNHGKYREKD